jgi:glycosyltransferase involved in cell wall biosynthesis
MKLGVAIPCFINHIEQCYALLESINQQTRIPDQVVVSCSSSKSTDFIKREYKFPLIVITTEDKQIAAQNRNAAAKLLDTDIIAFMDADDIMHPQRLEIIERAIEGGADIVLHNYFYDNECELPFPHINNDYIMINVLEQCISGCIKFKSGGPIFRIHHSQVSVPRRIFEKVQFSVEAVGKEDCVFCHNIFDIPNIQSAFIPWQLSKYTPSRTSLGQ